MLGVAVGGTRYLYHSRFRHVIPPEIGLDGFVNPARPKELLWPNLALDFSRWFVDPATVSLLTMKRN